MSIFDKYWIFNFENILFDKIAVVDGIYSFWEFKFLFVSLKSLKSVGNNRNRKLENDSY